MPSSASSFLSKHISVIIVIKACVLKSEMYFCVFYRIWRERLHEDFWIYYSRCTYIRTSFLFGWFRSHMAGKSVLFLNYNSCGLPPCCLCVRACVCVDWQQHSAGDIMIRNIQLRHAGKYTCAVQTKVDSISIAVDLVVRGKLQQCMFNLLLPRKIHHWSHHLAKQWLRFQNI